MGEVLCNFENDFADNLMHSFSVIFESFKGKVAGRL